MSLSSFPTEKQSDEVSADFWTVCKDPYGSGHCCSWGFPFHDVSEYRIYEMAALATNEAVTLLRSLAVYMLPLCTDVCILRIAKFPMVYVW